MKKIVTVGGLTPTSDRGGKMFKKLTSFVLCAILLVCCPLTAEISYGAVTEVPELTGLSAVLINADTGEVLYDKYKDYPRFPASTTKVMTALLALEHLDMDQVYTISHDAAYTEGSRIYLLEGEQVTAEQLLYAMMLASANDAAIALAEACAGDVESFAEMMNEKAEELGAQNTHFVTPNGLPEETHVTSAADMALFAREAMKNEKFREIVSTYEYVIPPTNLQPEERLIHNSNRLLYDTKSKADIGGVVRPYKYDGILGIKTGYTNAARSCLVAAAERNGMTLIGVVYTSEPEALYPDMIKLLDFGFDNFKPVDLGIEAGSVVGKASVRGGKKGSVDVTVRQDVRATAELMADGSVPDGSEADFEIKIESDDVSAPLKKGDKVGNLVVYQDSKPIAQFAAFAAEDMEESFLSTLLSDLSPVKLLVPILVIVLLAALAVYLRFAAKLRKRSEQESQIRREERERRKREEKAAPDDLTVKYQTAKLRLNDLQKQSKQPERFE